MDDMTRGAVADFAAAIKKTKEYETYFWEKEKVKNFPELKEEIDQYRRKNYELQSQTDDSELFDKMEEFEKEYARFRENPLVNDFLAAELAFCRMMQEVNVAVTEALDFE